MKTIPDIPFSRLHEEHTVDDLHVLRKAADRTQPVRSPQSQLLGSETTTLKTWTPTFSCQITPSFHLSKPDQCILLLPWAIPQVYEAKTLSSELR